MGEALQRWSARGDVNCVQEAGRVIVMREADAAGALYDEVAAGSSVSTVTASPGLLFMMPTMHKISKARLPCVFHVTAGPTLAPTMSIFGDQSDVMAVRSTGFSLLSSHTVQECHDLALVAHLASVACQMPFVHFFDGLRTSHETTKADLAGYTTLAKLKKVSDDCAAQQRTDEEQIPTADIPNEVETVMAEVNQLLGTNYHLFDYTGAPDAELVMVLMGSGASVAKAAVHLMVQAGQKIGVLTVHLYRPWSPRHFLAALPSTVKRIAVLERAVESTSVSNPLLTDVTVSFHHSTKHAGGGWDSNTCAMPVVSGAVYGLGSEDFHPGNVRDVFDQLNAGAESLTIRNGSECPRLDVMPAASSSSSASPVVQQYIFWGLATDGSSAAAKRTLHAMAAEPAAAVQGYFLHDSNDTYGVVTSAHVRVGPASDRAVVTAGYLVDEADAVVCYQSQPLFMSEEYDLLSRLKGKGKGTLVLNSNWSEVDFDARLTPRLKAKLAEREAVLVAVDAGAAAKTLGLHSRLDLVMQVSFCWLQLQHSGVSLPTGAAPPVPPHGEAVNALSRAMNEAVDALTAVLQRQSTMTHAQQANGGDDKHLSARERVLKACTGSEVVVKIEYDPISWTKGAPTSNAGARECSSFPGSLPHMLMPMTVETPYQLLLQRLFGSSLEVLNSNGHLFEDNAEFGLGKALAERQRRLNVAAKVRTVAESSSTESGGMPRALLLEWAESVEQHEGEQTGADQATSKATAEALGAQLLAAAEAGHLKDPALASLANSLPQLVRSTTASYWVVGGDGWSYDVGYGGIDSVLQSGLDVNILLLETTPFIAGVKEEEGNQDPLHAKVAMGNYAMHHSSGPNGGAFVASATFYGGAGGDDQLATCLRQAHEFSGPSLVLAYCPEGGTLQRAEGRQAVDEGRWPLYRWDPSTVDAAGNKGTMWIDGDASHEKIGDLMGDANQHAVVVHHPHEAFDAPPTTKTGLMRQKSLEDKLQENHEERAATASISQEALKSTFSQLYKSITGDEIGTGGGGGALPPSPLLVLYGSDGGNAEQLGKRFASEGKERGHPVEVMGADKYDLSKLGQTENQMLLFVVSTAGQGEFPGNSHNFWEGISKDGFTLPAETKLRYAVMALGDRNYWPRPEEYIYFCMPGKDLDARLEKLGAERICKVGIGDDQDADKWETGAEKFGDEFWGAVDSLHSGGAAVKPKAKKVKVKARTVEDIKYESRFLRGTIAEGLVDTTTGALAADDTQLTKFHGIYQQDDRDLRPQMLAEGKEKAYSFMIRVAVPGGLMTCQQWLQLDQLADLYANGTLKITTRQAVQYHGILKNVLKTTMQGINKALLTALAACGDVNRNVMCAANPHQSQAHEEAYRMSCDLQAALLPQTSAYHEIWLDKKPVVGYKDIEPLYGSDSKYLPRKFKIAVSVPPDNDVDTFAHCLGYIAILERGKVVGWNVTVGGGMGMTHNNKKTFPRVADIMGFCTTAQSIEIAKAVVMVQRDFGNRLDRKQARLKYTIENMGLAEFKKKVEAIIGYVLPPPRNYKFESNTDRYGWTKGLNNTWHYGVYVPNGRVKDVEGGLQLKTAMRAICGVHQGGLRMTSNQHLIIADVKQEERPTITRLLKQFMLDAAPELSGIRKSSMACVALPTCGHALAEAERYLPELITELENVLAEAGIRDDDIVIRMTGCPNGCARPYLAEIALVGRAPGIYNLYLGASHTGDRLSKLWKEALNGEQIVEELTPIFHEYAKEGNRVVPEGEDREWFGDFCIRKGYIQAQHSTPRLKLDSEGAPEGRAPGVTFHEHTSIW
jgi:sulfite reductase (NADPH) hemoprotein beta-component